MARNEQFRLFPQCFLPYVNDYDIISLFAAEMEEPKIGMWGKGIMHYTESKMHVNPLLNNPRF